MYFKIGFQIFIAVSSGLKLHETFQFETWVICVCVVRKLLFIIEYRYAFVEMYALHNSSGAFQSLQCSYFCNC